MYVDYLVAGQQIFNLILGLRWDIITAIVLSITAVSIAKQALATKELAEKTLMPNTYVGLKIMNDKTYLVFLNLSNFQTYVWTTIDLFLDKKYSIENRIDRISSNNGLEEKIPLGPAQPLPYPVEKIDWHINQLGQGESIFAVIEYRCTLTDTLPTSDVKSIKQYYGFTKGENKWFIDPLGIEMWFPPFPYSKS